MKIITAWTEAATAAARWKAQYGHYPTSFRLTDGTDPRTVLKLLEELGENPEPRQVTEIAGASWARVPDCSECRNGASMVIVVGQEPDYESATAWLCRKCVERAAKAMREAVQ